MSSHSGMSLHDLASRIGATIKRGLSDSEVVAVQDMFDIIFPPDLRQFLQAGLPTGEGWPNWAEALSNAIEAERIREMLKWPLDGMVFDVEENMFWDTTWGVRPIDRTERVRVVTQAVAAAPRLIQIYGHRYMPAEPSMSGNPVFSIHQTDIIIYGSNLETYLLAETKLAPIVAEAREIRDWTRWMNAH